jgi:uncharacterized Zn finger protein (UPF0148 family)
MTETNGLMASDKLVVPASRAKFGKTLLGGFQVVYPCPRCGQELTTKNEAVATGDNCPICQATFVFDEPIREAFVALVREKKEREQRKLAAETEKEKLREARKQEQVRAAAEAADKFRLQREMQRSLEDQHARQSSRSRKQIIERDALNIEEARGCLMVIFGLAGAATAVLLFGAFALFANSQRYDDKSAATTLLVVGISAAVSLTLVYVFFRILGAIHGVLVMILERLESSSDRR